jgi:cytochrome c oxidase assembly factor CtaG
MRRVTGRRVTAVTRWEGMVAVGGAGAGLLLAVLGPLAAIALAHGIAPAGPPDLVGLATQWSFDPTVWLPVLWAASAYLLAVRQVDLHHPEHPEPVWRRIAFLAGLGSILVALQSGLERYDTTLFSLHMVQHVLLAFVAPPLLALGAPVTLALRVSSPRIRQRVLLPILHSRVVRGITFPAVGWLAFTAVLWWTHFSPIYNLALEDPAVHQLEHALLFVSGLLFWWPVVGLDPSPWRLSTPFRVAYVFLQMPVNTFLGVAILTASQPLYPHYATLVRSWGPTPLEDQQLAGGIMWAMGDPLFFVVIMAILAQWMGQEERRVERREAQEARRAAGRPSIEGLSEAGQPDG